MSTQVVVTLRDLRDVQPPESRRWPPVPVLTVVESREAQTVAWLAELLGLAEQAVEWRAGSTDRMEQGDLAEFLRQMTKWIGGDSAVHLPLAGADLVLSMTREPAQ